VIAVLVFVQVAEARQRHQAEREEIQRGNALERRRLAQEERQAAAERVHNPQQPCSMGTSGLFVYHQPASTHPLAEITALLPSCTASAVGSRCSCGQKALVVLSCWHGFAQGS